MENVDDVFDALESGEEPFKDSNDNKPSYNNNKQNYKQNYNGYNKSNFKPKQESLWDKTDFKPMLIDAIKLKSFGNCYCLYTYVPKGSTTGIDENDYKTLLSVAKSLNTRDYVFRHNQDAENKLANDILNIENIKSESYLPWGKFNSKIEKPKRFSPSKEAYSIALAYHAKFKDIPPAVRAILANTVDTLLGPNCTTPVNFLLCWTECGSEKYKSKMDYSKAGSLPYWLKLCEDANIPVFNFKNKTALNDLKEILK